MDLSFYKKLYDDSFVLPEHKESVLSRVQIILDNKNNYIMVGASTKVPWDVIACIHSLESDLCWTRHLHNGDPLTNRTIHVPVGRPKLGAPPFTWIDSAIDAIGAYPRPLLWDTGVKLYFLESYNGMGYRQYKINSPYLWSMTNQYEKGKFDHDGHFDPNLVSQQIGAVAMLKTIASFV